MVMNSKKYKKYKRAYRRRPRRRYGNTWASNSIGLAKTALKTAKWVAGLVNAEAKDYYINQTSFATTNTGSTRTSLNGGITQGTADGQRTGDSIKVKTVTIRGDLSRNGADDIVRIIVYWDKENTSTGSNLLQYTGSSQVVNSPKNDDKYYQTRFLTDRKYIINTQNPNKQFKIVIPVNAHSKYNNSTNTIENGSLYIGFYSQLATGTNCEFISKLTYMDN